MKFLHGTGFVRENSFSFGPGSEGVVYRNGQLVFVTGIVQAVSGVAIKIALPYKAHLLSETPFFGYFIKPRFEAFPVVVQNSSEAFSADESLSPVDPSFTGPLRFVLSYVSEWGD